MILLVTLSGILPAWSQEPELDPGTAPGSATVPKSKDNSTAAPAIAQPHRTWTDQKGRQHSGKLLAFDNVRATLQLDDSRVISVTPRSLSSGDQTFLAEWRKDNTDGSWVDPRNMPAWPIRSGTGRAKVIAVQNKANNSRFIYHSANFAITSDVSLPLNTVADMATAFEATRRAVLDLPLGLGAKPKLPPRRRGPNQSLSLQMRPAFSGFSPYGNARPHTNTSAPQSSRRLPVELYITPQAYGLAGGAAGTGGYYSAWHRTMLISLQNFGIKIDENKRVTLDYQDKVFILRHEVSHQVMRDWLPHLPVWISEGMAEYLAALPYQNGHYNFTKLEKPFIAYLNKWRYDDDPRVIPMIAPAKMLTMTSKEWTEALSMSTPILNYNSAALLVWYFLYQDGDGKASDLAAYFQAIQQKPQNAQAFLQIHLLRGRAPEKIATEIRAAWKKNGVEIVFQSPPEP